MNRRFVERNQVSLEASGLALYVASDVKSQRRLSTGETEFTEGKTMLNVNF